MKYGELPKEIGTFEIASREMMFYQYLPIKLIGQPFCNYENRLNVFNDLINECIDNYIQDYGYEDFINSNIYLTAKHQYQTPNNSFNRMGYHSDGFMTEDINYIWCDVNPTIFNSTEFILTIDDVLSMKEMEEQAKPDNEITFGNNKLLRLNQFNIHKVANVDVGGFRTFLKISFSKDRYDLLGNSHNYELDYDWEMKERKSERNIPQSTLNNI